MLTSAKMSRIRIIALKRYYEVILSALHDTGTVQIEQVGDIKGPRSGESISYGNISAYAQRFRSLETMLSESGQSRYTFKSMNDLLSTADSIDIDDELIGATRKLSGNESALNALRHQLSIISALKGFTKDLSILSTKNVVSYIVRNSTKSDMLHALKSEVRAHIRDSILIEGKGYMIVSVVRGKEPELANLVDTRYIAMDAVPELHGSVRLACARMRNSINELEKESSRTKKRVAGLSDRYYPIVSAVSEQLGIELRKQEITTRIGQDERIMVIEGWTPMNTMRKTEELLKRSTSDTVAFEVLKTKELPPTKLENPRPSRLFEFFIRFYSLPKSNEIDPTLIFAIVFPIFFGLMVGDTGYGAVMLAFSLWLVHRIKHPPKKSRIPKRISSFVNTIISNQGLSFIARAIMPGAIFSMVLGVLFNNYFGFSLPYTPIFAIEAGLSKLIVISGWIGVAMVSFGLVLGFVNNMLVGRVRRAIGKIGWLVTAWGIVLIGLTVLHGQPIGMLSQASILYISIILAGILIFTIGEGVQSLMEIPSIISHMLSYTRLVGILLASVILAKVIDLVFMSGLHHSVIFAVAGTIILVVGQLFNIVIAVFEPGIQGARLIYVEFFSKFLLGNATEFKPFQNERKHTLSRFSLE